MQSMFRAIVMHFISKVSPIQESVWCHTMCTFIMESFAIWQSKL